MINISNPAVAAGALFLLFQSATGPPAQSRERHVLLTNNTHEAIVEVHVSDVGSGNWQVDLLGSDFLMPGGSVLWSISTIAMAAAELMSGPSSTMAPTFSAAALTSAAARAPRFRCANLAWAIFGADHSQADTCC